MMNLNMKKITIVLMSIMLLVSVGCQEPVIIETSTPTSAVVTPQITENLNDIAEKKAIDLVVRKFNFAIFIRIDFLNYVTA